jgi:hypothetical protein
MVSVALVALVTVVPEAVPFHARQTFWVVSVTDVAEVVLFDTHEVQMTPFVADAVTEL